MADNGAVTPPPRWVDDRLPLLERGLELVTLGRLLDGLAEGVGGVALIEGIAGVGKTRLLSTVADQARTKQVRVLSARASEFEDRFPLGVVRQLFEPVVRAHKDVSRLLRGAEQAGELLLGGPGSTHETALSGAGDASFALLHSLYWLLVNLSDESPVLILVDDLHWADEPSQRFLAFCGSRLGEAPVAIVATSREPSRDPRSRAQSLTRLPQLVDIRPAPLTHDGVARLLHEVLGAQAGAEFVAACRLATGGVPFYTRELAHELARQGIRPDPENAMRVADVKPESIARAVVARVAGLPEPSLRVAWALAVLGGHAAAGEVAAVAEVARAEAGQVQQWLSDAGILERGRFAFQHPVIGASVYADIPELERERLHTRAVSVLRGAGAPADRVAAQLLRAPASGDADAVDVLISAANAVVARGAPADAVPLLLRAVAEPPTPALLPTVLLELGTAEMSIGAMVDAIGHLRAAVDGAEPCLRGPAALTLGRALINQLQLEEAAHLADTMAKELASTDPELALRLELDFVFAATERPAPAPLAIEHLPRIAQQAGASTPTRRLVLAWLAIRSIAANGPARVVAEYARAAYGSGDLVALEPPDSRLQWFVPYALILVDEYALADQAMAQWVGEARRQGSPGGLASAQLLGAMFGLLRGTLREAEADAMEALAISAEHPSYPFAAGVAAQVLIERGELDRAGQLVTEPAPNEDSTSVMTQLTYLGACALLPLARHQWRQGLDGMLEWGRIATSYGWCTPAPLPWRSLASVAALALGEHDRAKELADEDLRLAEAFGAPRPLAIALHAAGLVAGNDKGLELLAQALEIVAGRGIDIVEARVLTDLGAMLSRRGNIGAARERLRAGLDLAVRCGANPLVERARQELLATGARPRRSTVAGAEALTAAERRVCHLATDGLSNREIAQALFVTVKTVELHLTNSYRKLAVRRRSELGAALDRQSGRPAG